MKKFLSYAALVLGVIGVLDYGAFVWTTYAVTDHDRFRTFGVEVLKPEHLNDWQDDTVNKINELVALHGGDSTLTVHAAHDTVSALNNPQVTLKDPLWSLSADDSLKIHLSNLFRVHADTVWIGGEPPLDPSWALGITAGARAHFAYADIDSLVIDDDLTITTDVTFSDGYSINIGNATIDSLSSDSINVVGKGLTVANGTTAAVFTSAGTTDLTGTFKIGGTTVTSTAAELNKVDGYTGTTANLNTLTDDSMADALHRHSELSASDGTPNAYITVDATGNAVFSGGLSVNGTFSTTANFGTVTAINSATANELTTIGATTTELDAEANLTFDGTTLDVVGNAGVGIARTDGTLHVHTATAGAVAANANADELVIENSGNAGVNILTPAASAGAVYFGDPVAANQGQIVFNHTTNSFLLTTDAAASTGININSSNQVGVGGSATYDFDVLGSTASNFTGRIQNSNATAPSVAWFHISGAAPDDNTSLFLQASDNSTVRLYIYSDGDVVNHDNSYGAISDARSKVFVTSLPPVLNKLLALDVIEYNVRDEPLGDRQIGINAQTLAPVFPTMVDTGGTRFYPAVFDTTGGDSVMVVDSTTVVDEMNVAYSKLTPTLVQGLQEQHAYIDSLFGAMQGQIVSLQAQVDSLKALH